MLPAGSVLARRSAGSRHGIVAVGARWFRRAGARKCSVTARPTAPRGHYAFFDHPRLLRPGAGDSNAAGPSASGYCTTHGAGKKTVPFLLADIGEGISEVTVKEWFVNAGDRVAEFDDVCEVESDKAAVTITSRYAGTVTKIHHEAGGTVRVGSALVDIEVDDEAGSEPTVAVPVATDDVSVQSSSSETSRLDRTTTDSQDDRNAGKVLTTPAVRRIAAEKSIDLTTVQGTGKHGRVLKEDLLDLEGNSVAGIPTPAPTSAPTSAANSPVFIPLTGYDRAMRNTMEMSSKIPTLVITDEVDLTRLIELKKQISEHVKVTLFPFLVKASSLALLQHPRINSTASPDYGSYRLNESHNIGVAIDTPIGLAVPNIKNVQKLTVMEVADQLAQLRAKAIVGKLRPADVTGGTFTLSNMGSIAGSSFRPVILPHEASIGALGRLKYRPRYDAQERLVRTPVMDVSWAADHRILDGATVARFFKDWKIYVENPSLILAGVKLYNGREQ